MNATYRKVDSLFGSRPPRNVRIARPKNNELSCKPAWSSIDVECPHTEGVTTAVGVVLDEPIHFEVFLRRTVGTIVRADINRLNAQKKRIPRAETQEPLLRTKLQEFYPWKNRYALYHIASSLMYFAQFYFPAL